MAQQQNLYPRALDKTILADSLLLLGEENRFLRMADREKAQLSVAKIDNANY